MNCKFMFEDLEAYLRRLDLFVDASGFLSGFISLELPFLFSPLVFRSLGGDFGESFEDLAVLLPNSAKANDTGGYFNGLRCDRSSAGDRASPAGAARTIDEKSRARRIAVEMPWFAPVTIATDVDM